MVAKYNSANYSFDLYGLTFAASHKNHINETY